MAQHIIQATFSKGELSPYVAARVDLGLYQAGLEQCLNWIVLPQGGLIRRPGSRFVGEVADSNRKTRLIAFQYSTEMSYVLEFSHLKIRVYKDRGLIVTGSDKPLEITTPFTEDQIFDLHHTQSENELYLTSEHHAPRRLTRSSHTSWTLEAPGLSGGSWGGEHPKRVCFFENRLILAATNSKPNTIWGSEIGKYTNFSKGTEDTDPIEFAVQAGQVNAINWLVEDHQLQFGTDGATRTIGGENDAALTATSVKQRPHTKDATIDVQPIQTSASTLFAGAYGRVLREFVYSFEADRFQAPNLSVLSDHILASGIKEMTFAQDPYPIVWMCLNNGEVAGLTYERDQSVAAWHVHRLGGDAGQGWGEVESICTIDGPENDEVWMVVKRTINGATKRYIEYLTPPFNGRIMDKSDAIFVDSALTYDGGEAKTFAGLQWLEGETISILADGAVEPERVVTNGSFELQKAGANKVIAGLKYQSIGRTLRMALNGSDGSLLGRSIQVPRLSIDVLDTQLLKAGSYLDELEYTTVRNTSDPLDSAPELFTGFTTITINDSADTGGQVYFMSDSPLPANIRAITPAVQTE